MASKNKMAWTHHRLESHRRAQQDSLGSGTTPTSNSRELEEGVQQAEWSEEQSPGDPKLLWVGDLGYEVTDELLKAAFTQVRQAHHTKSAPASPTR